MGSIHISFLIMFLLLLKKNRFGITKKCREAVIVLRFNGNDKKQNIVVCSVKGLMKITTLYSRIVVPFDNSPLSKKALEFAKNLASENKSIELYVIMVLQPEVTYSYALPKNEENRRKTIERVKEEVEAELKMVPNNTKTFILRGNPSREIIDFAKENEVDLIVIGSRGLSGFKEVFLGSVSHHVVQRAKCPVLVVK